MERKILASLAHRRLVPPCDVGRGLVEKTSKTAEKVEQYIREFGERTVVQGRQVGDAIVRVEWTSYGQRAACGTNAVHLPRAEHDCDPAVISSATTSSNRFRPVRRYSRRRGDHPVGPRRDERVRVDLPMRVLQGDADLGAGVLETVDLLYPGKGAEGSGLVDQCLEKEVTRRGES